MKQYRKIGDICTVISGTTPKSNKAEYWNGDRVWITPAEISEDSVYISDSERHITDIAVKESSLKSFPKGTVILSSRAPIGKVAIAGCEMYCNQGFKNLICSDDVYNGYLYFYLKAKKDYLNALGRGATFKEISKKIVENIEVPLPAIPEQKRMAAILFKIDTIIQRRNSQLQKLDELVKSRFIEMFGDPAVPGQIYSTRKLGEVAQVKSSHRVFTKDFVDDGIPFYRGTEIGILAEGKRPENVYHITREHFDKIANDDSKPERGDLLMPSICNKMQVWMVDTDEPFYYKDGRVLCISPDRTVFDSMYLQLYMKMRTKVEYPKLGSGSTFAEFKIFQLKELEVDVPPIESQLEFTKFYNRVGKSKLAIKKSLNDLETLKKSLMQQYFG